MRKKSPRPQPQPATATEKPKRQAPRVRPDNLTREEVQAWRRYRRDSLEIERQYWRITTGG